MISKCFDDINYHSVISDTGYRKKINNHWQESNFEFRCFATIKNATIFWFLITQEWMIESDKCKKMYVFKKLKLSKAIETSFKRNFNDNFLHVIKLKSVFINALPWWYLFVLNAVCYAIDTQTMRENFPKLLSIFKKCFSYLKNG